jgi:hypothetical protein
MLILKFNDRTIDTFEKKIKMFKNVFFSTLSSIDLIDISRFFYFDSIECSLSITKTKVFTIIKRFVLDKISSFDDFINKLLKACALIMIKLLTFFFEICIQLFYYSKTFEKVNTIILKKTKKKQLHHFKNVSIHNIFEHHEQDHEIDNILLDEIR